MSEAENSFDSFWNRIILRSIRFCSKEIDSDFFSQTSLKMRNPVEYRDELEKTYKKKRAWLKYEYLPDEDDPSLDMHKLGAILCRCIIGNKFYSYDVGTAHVLQSERIHSPKITHKEQLKWEVDNLYVNYKLAFLVGEGVAFDDLLFWAQNRILEDSDILAKSEDHSVIEHCKRRIEYTKEFIKRLEIDRKHRRYGMSKTHDDFVSSVIVSLVKTDRLLRDFDYLMFATILFQWQEYTKTRLFAEILNQKLCQPAAEMLDNWLQLCLSNEHIQSECP